MCVGVGVELFGGKEQRLRWKCGALRVGADDAVAILRVFPESLEGRFQVAMQHHRSRCSQVVEDGGGVLKEQGQVVLDTGGGDTVAHVLVNAALGRIAFQQFPPSAAKARAGSIVHGEFTPGQ